MSASPPFGPLRQTATYLGGMAGSSPLVPFDYAQLEQRAKAAMSSEAFAYVACGAGREDTVRRNTQAFARWRIRPRMLAGVESRDLTIELFGRRLPAPLLLAPIGVQEMAHDEADLATAKAAASCGVPMIFSNQASVAMETCAAAMGSSPRLFQLYWNKDRDVVASLVRRAEACGCLAIVVTLDTTILGWRTQDLDLAFLPFLRGMGIAQYVTDPAFCAKLNEPPEANISAAVQRFVQTYSNPALSWSDLAFLREHTSLPIVLKGIQRGDDALKAIDHGVDGVVVSNHGGRQVDGAIGSVEALPEVAEAISGRAPILFDSGIRGGADMFKALALGATAVCLGRPYVYGLAIAGEAGVSAVIANMLADFDVTMGLAGCRAISEIGADCLRGEP